MTVMYATIRHTDGYRQSYAAAYPDHTPREAYEQLLAVLMRPGGCVVGDPDALTITTRTPTVEVVREFTGDIA